MKSGWKNVILAEIVIKPGTTTIIVVPGFPFESYNYVVNPRKDDNRVEKN